MALTAWQALSALLLLSCLSSFAWGMHKFFVQPSGATVGMRIVSACGVLFAALHLAAIVLPNGVSAQRGAVAALFYLGSLVLFWWAIRTNSAIRLSAVFSLDLPLHLVKGGPYRFIRHPFYCSYLLAWFGGIAATGRLWLVPTVVVMIAIYLRAARGEEQKFLRSTLAGDYVKYRERTAFLLPNPMKLLVARRPE